MVLPLPSHLALPPFPPELLVLTELAVEDLRDLTLLFSEA